MNEVFNKYFRMVALFCGNILKSKEDGEEIAGDVFLALWKCIDNFKTEEQLRAFIFKTARNKCINFSIQKGNHKNIKTVEISEDYLDHEEINAIVIENIYAQMYTEIELLPQQQRSILKSYLSGLGAADISYKLGISYKTVCNVKDIAIKKIKSKLGWYISEYIHR